ncbi:ATP-grasp domain-containing protein [Lichenicoccus roseus]|uniref:ATP-grasp domain-containing protein n=1 Tax=Lichenicoccus roseus TaxID=2683649 RepID=A0A5R9J9Q2_9PROT|nr:hypothetical protein [Lichenicoccus roseus]TLU74344.1 hypothetical protein FE263_03925 [Lichenicoccus roseus]
MQGTIDPGDERARWQHSRTLLEAATQVPASRRDAHRVLWETCQALGDRTAALLHLQMALAEGAFFTRPCRRPAKRSVLMLCVPGDFQANLPLDRLFDDTTLLHTLWITDPRRVLADPEAALPPELRAAMPFDCVFIAIAEDARHVAALAAADALADCIAAPVINQGARVGGLSRAGAATLLRGLPDAIVPEHVTRQWGDPAPIGPPLIIRPIGSHAGSGLERITGTEALADYDRRHQGLFGFTVSPFIDYRSPDGQWRKFRFVFVDGTPYPLHLGIHHNWAVWYYNAGMEQDAAKGAEEDRFLATPQTVLPARARAALHALGQRVGLDYFGLDCGVMPDGRLLVFEVETGMIVHDRRSGEPGGPDPAGRIRLAVEAMIDRRSPLRQEAAARGR